MGKWPRPGTGQPPNPRPAKSNCDDCQGYGGKYILKNWIKCETCKGSGKKLRRPDDG
jgi:DnaJ-class molecular chaperone